MPSPLSPLLLGLDDTNVIPLLLPQASEVLFTFSTYFLSVVQIGKFLLSCLQIRGFFSPPSILLLSPSTEFSKHWLQCFSVLKFPFGRFFNFLLLC